MAILNPIQLLGALDLGLIYALVAVAVYLSFRVLQFSDLTVDGSFPLGAAVTAALISRGTNPFTATLVATLAGALAGLVTAWLSTHLRVFNVLAGILTMTALYSINLRVMGGHPNVSILSDKTILTGPLRFLPEVVVLGGIVLVVGVLTYWFLNTQIGLAIRATGNNPRMAKALGINDHHMIWLGLSFSNGLVALAGSLFAQKHGFADVTMGLGTVIIGLASVIIAEALLPSQTVKRALIACAIGAILYRLVVAIALNVGGFGLRASDLNLVTAALVAVAMLVLKRTFK